MRKFLSTLLCFVLLLGILPVTGLTASAAGITQIGANQTYSITWDDTTKNRSVYCVVTDKYGKTVKSSVVQLKMK